MANLDLTEQLNRHLISMEDDYLYHLSLSKKDAEMFSGVRYVIIGGSNDRMTAFAAIVAEQLGLGSASVKSVGAHKRYVSFLVGPVFICSHGMGGPSISILLNEIAKLLIYANANAVWIRMGTCGGIGLEGGSIAITQQSYNAKLEPYHESYVLGKLIQRPASFDDNLSRRLQEVSKSIGYDAFIGKTMTADDFYEGQGRLDGAFCDFEEQDKLQFLKKAQEVGVINIEMESLYFGSFTQKLGVRAATICSCILNRLKGDQIQLTPAEYADFESRSGRVLCEFLKQDWEQQSSIQLQ